MPQRPLITAADVDRAARDGHRSLAVPPDAIITPMAYDALRQHGIEVVAPSSTLPMDSAASLPSSARVKTLAIGSDHGGFAYKAELKQHLDTLGWDVIDVGTHTAESCDYPDFAYAVARMVQRGDVPVGIMIDGAGLGSSMVANKVAGVRAACAYNEFTAWNARAHNNANVLTLGSRTMGIEVVKRMAGVFLATDFEGGRHQRRVGKIDDLDAHR
ncbi:MAG: ribose 5-phosphate isomerase B [Bacteroidota bacterium]